MNEVIVMSSITSNNGFTFPLWLYSANGTRTENLSPTFRAFIDSLYDHHYTPEEILGYIYAVLHAPSYRTRFVQFLRSDFPHISFPKSSDEFEKLSKLGWTLLQVHLLRKLPRKGLGAYQGKGDDHTVEAVKYLPGKQAVSINKAQFFKPIPRDVWEFHIGGYQVIDKFLKSRKGRALTLDEINHIGAITETLAFTIEQMAKIDETYKAAFAERG
jgi:predicted helicase